MKPQPVDPRPVFRTSEQLRLNSRRLELLGACGLAPVQERVLDLGAGVGDLDSFFLDRGCEVVVTDAREQNLVSARADLANAMEGTDAARRLGFEVLHLERASGSGDRGRFGAVVCFGVLHLVERPAEAIAWAAAQARRVLLVDAVVTTGAGEAAHTVAAASGTADGAAGTRESRVTRGWLYARLREAMPHVYALRVRPRHEAYPGDWSAETTRRMRSARAMFVASRVPMANPWLVAGLPERHEDGA